MDRFGDYISLILKGVHISQGRKKEIEDELREHLKMSKKELINEGYTEEQAELEAIKRLGEVEEIKSSFKTLFTPYRRFVEIINERMVLKEAIQWTFSIVGAFALALTLRSYVFASTEVKQCSMEGTLYEGQRLVESKLGYYYSNPKRGDIVIINLEAENGILDTFISNTTELVQGLYKKEQSEKRRLIKRIIGVPGDKIDIKEGKVYINGNVYNEEYTKGITMPRSIKFPIVIPEKAYFVLGDNRENSMDSRDLGLVNSELIEGKAVLRLWPLDKFGGIN